MKRKLGDLAIIVKSKDSVEKIDRNKYVTTENMISNRGGVSFPSSTVPKQKKLDIFDKDDVLVSNIRPYFKKIWKASFSGYKSGDVLAFRTKDRDILSQEYLYILLESDRFFEYMTTTAKGTKMPRGDKKAIAEFPFDLPSIDIQKKRSHQIEVIEQKIRLNQQINANLLELGLSLLTNTNFKKYQLLNDLLEVKDGTHSSPANVSNGGHPLVTSKAIKGVSVDFSQTKNISEVDFAEINKRSLVEYHDILVSMIGTVGIIHLVTEKPVNYAIKNVGLIKSSNNKMLATFLYFYLLSNHGQTYIKENLSGSTQQFISLTNLRKMQIPLLSEISSELLKQLNYMAQQIEKNSKENNILISIKNSLLEKYF